MDFFTSSERQTADNTDFCNNIRSSLMASFVLSFFPLYVLDEIWDLIESVSEGFLTYSYNVDVV